MIEIRNLKKKYGGFVAVDDVNITAPNGKITILLGPNGAGKSTTIKSIIGFLKYEGDIMIEGFDNRSVEAKQIMGYVPETPVLYDTLTIMEHIHFIGKAYNLPDYLEYSEYLLERFKLVEKRDVVAKELSKGMTQKLSLLLALLIKPQALLIDEPMVGLDPSAIEDVLQLLIELKEKNTSILLSTHIIDIVDEIWDEAYIMDKGQIHAHVVREEGMSESLKDIFFRTISE